MNNIIVSFIMLLGYIIVAADAITDASIYRKSNVNRFAWHFFKWLRYYIPFAIIVALMLYAKLISVNKLTVLGLIAYAVIGWILWKVFYITDLLSDSDSAEI